MRSSSKERPFPGHLGNYFALACLYVHWKILPPRVTFLSRALATSCSCGQTPNNTTSRDPSWCKSSFSPPSILPVVWLARDDSGPGRRVQGGSTRSRLQCWSVCVCVYASGRAFPRKFSQFLTKKIKKIKTKIGAKQRLHVSCALLNTNWSSSFFRTQPSSLLIFFSNLGKEGDSLWSKPGSPC